MPDLSATIKQKEESHARFDRPAKNLTTGEALLDEASNPKPFIPNSLRGNCPLKASKYSNDDLRMKKLLEEGKKLWEAW